VIYGFLSLWPVGLRELRELARRVHKCAKTAESKRELGVRIMRNAPSDLIVRWQEDPQGGVCGFSATAFCGDPLSWMQSATSK